jgi:hypothetical protein
MAQLQSVIIQWSLSVKQKKEAKGKAASRKGEVKWVERDYDGRPIPKRSRSGGTRMGASATGILWLSRLFVVITHLHNLS